MELPVSQLQRPEGVPSPTEAQKSGAARELPKDRARENLDVQAVWAKKPTREALFVGRQCPRNGDFTVVRPSDSAATIAGFGADSLLGIMEFIWPWVKIQIIPPVNIPIPTEIDQNGWCTYPKMVPLVLTRSHFPRCATLTATSAWQ